MRKFFAVATTLIVVCFAYIIASAPQANAADASWQSGSIQYENNTYQGPIEVTQANEPPELQVGSNYYVYLENSESPSVRDQKAHVIYFAPGSDPGTATSAQYRTYDHMGGGRFTNPAAVQVINVTPASASDPLNSGSSSCDVGFGVGWMVCGVSKGLAWAVDKVFEFIKGFLEVRPLSTNTDNGIYNAWSIMRSIANVAFVIAFLFVIYSQLLGGGAGFGDKGVLSNYTIKKMVPRIILAAILVNISYWICAIAVDITNILGTSLQELLISIRNTAIGSSTYDWDVLNWEDLMSYILSGGAAVGGSLVALKVIGMGSAATLSANLALLLLPMLLLFLIAVIVVFFILAARQAIIVILIVLAPLAFVAYILPNTEKWFEKWRSIFATMLMVYPMFSLLFGGSQLAAALMIQNASSIYMIILGMGIQLVPLAITPFLLKLSGGVLNRFAGIINNPGKGVVDRTKNWANEKVEHNKAEQLDRNRQLGITQKARKFGKNKGEMRYSRLSARGRALNSYYGAQQRKAETEAYQGQMGESFHGTDAYARIDQIKRLTDQSKRRNDGEHEAHWSQQFDARNPHFNSALTESEMMARHAASQGEQYKVVADAVYSELQAGENTTGITGLDSVKSDAKITTRDAALSAMRKQMAERKQAGTRADELKAEEALRVYAGGVMGETGQTSVEASAKSTASKFFVDDMKNIQDTMEYELATNVPNLMTAFERAPTMTHRIAYLNAMAKNGGDGVKKLEDAIVHFENSGASPADKLLFKELLGTNPSIRQAGKHFDDWINNGQGLGVEFSAIRNDISTWNNMSSGKFAAMNSKIQELAISKLSTQDPAAYATLVESIREDTAAKNLMKQEILTLMGIR